MTCHVLLYRLFQSGFIGYLSEWPCKDRCFRVLKVADIPDIGDGVLVKTGAGDLVVFVVHKQVLPVVHIQQPALVGVAEALV